MTESRGMTDTKRSESNKQTHATETSPDSRPVKVRPVAVIDIGTTSIRMEVAEIGDDGSIRSLQRLFQAVNLGRDTFTRGSLHKNRIEECVRILRSYRRVLDEYQITQPDQIRVVATSSIREADNRLTVLDRIYSATGFQIEPIEAPDVIRITYLGIQPLLRAEATLFAKTSMIVEVGGGSTELLLVHGEDVLTSQTYRLGTVRMHESLLSLRSPQLRTEDIMADHIGHMIDQMQQHIVVEGVDQMVALGGDMRFAASQLLEKWTPNELARVPLPALEKLTRGLLKKTPDQIVREYRLSYADAETLSAALLTNLTIAREFKLDHILVTRFNLRDGLLKDLAARDTWNSGFDDQIIRSARELLKKFHVDERHANHVEELSRDLFEKIRVEYQIDARHSVLLRVAALLHESGMFIGTSGFHKHSMYLMLYSEMFGLSRRDMLLAALVARYHRRASPKPTHQGYSSLTREERVLVRQLAAILRVADALDRSRSQRVRNIECTIKERQFVIRVPQVADLSVEQLALKQKGSLFEEIFGLQVILRPQQTLHENFGKTTL